MAAPPDTVHERTHTEFRAVALSDPLAAPLLDALRREYDARYGDASAEMARATGADFAPPGGALILLLSGGSPIAGGAFRRHDAATAEVKRMWTHESHRRRGLGRRVLAELERRAAEAGYARMYLTTGPRQPEARALYLAAGFTPRFDVHADPLTIGPLPFTKELAPAPALKEASRGSRPAHRPGAAP
ncbi:GNAT family N-acetyltransferase [Nocardiopsis sediminis]|uniref:GNAT family N-acetyltransferase n=1 Tax=Nocardiopsis sediminis TaxID=1778267 RepID=A0ABV8FQZ2_9ACTN